MLFLTTRFACDLLLWCPESSPLQQGLVTALYPLLLNSTMEHLAYLVTLSLECLVGAARPSSCHTSSRSVSHLFPPPPGPLQSSSSSSELSYLPDNGVFPLVLNLLQEALCLQASRDHGRWEQQN